MSYSACVDHRAAGHKIGCRPVRPAGRGAITQRIERPTAMRSLSRSARLLGAFVAICGAAASALAGPTSGTMYYTTFSGGQNVHKVDFSYNGANSFTFSNNTN